MPENKEGSSEGLPIDEKIAELEETLQGNSVAFFKQLGGSSVEVSEREACMNKQTEILPASIEKLKQIHASNLVVLKKELEGLHHFARGPKNKTTVQNAINEVRWRKDVDKISGSPEGKRTTSEKIDQLLRDAEKVYET